MPMVPLELQMKPFILLIILVNIVSLGIIYAKTGENIANRREVVSFKGMLASFMVYTLVDFRLLMGDAYYTAFPSIIVHFLVSLGFATMTFSCFFWFMHVHASLNSNSRFFKIKTLNFWAILIHIPLFIVLIMLFTPLHRYVYTITTVPEFKPPLAFILFIDYIYLIAATAISIHMRRKAKTRPEKKKYNSQIIFILFFTVSGYLIGYLINLPAIELCVIPVVLKIFVELQDSQIYTDALTKLYNRRRMADFLVEEIATCSEENPLTVIMIDLDYFKNINDILGHDEGDKALSTFSKALRKTIMTMDAVGARWGGDEFVVAGKDKALTENYKETLASTLKEVNALPYLPLFSMGVYSCTSTRTTYAEALKEADAALYKDKEISHRESSDFPESLHKIKKEQLH